MNAGVGSFCDGPPRRVAVLGLAVVAEGLTEVRQLGPLPQLPNQPANPKLPALELAVRESGEIAAPRAAEAGDVVRGFRRCRPSVCLGSCRGLKPYNGAGLLLSSRIGNSLRLKVGDTHAQRLQPFLDPTLGRGRQLPHSFRVLHVHQLDPFAVTPEIAGVERQEVPLAVGEPRCLRREPVFPPRARPGTGSQAYS